MKYLCMYILLSVPIVYIQTYICKHVYIYVIYTQMHVLSVLNICIFNIYLCVYICTYVHIYIYIFLYLDQFHFTRKTKIHQYQVSSLWSSSLFLYGAAYYSFVIIYRSLLY